jgi:hypothetical protein
MVSTVFRCLIGMAGTACRAPAEKTAMASLSGHACLCDRFCVIIGRFE